MKPNQFKLVCAVAATEVISLVHTWRIKRAAKELAESNDALHQLTDTLVDVIHAKDEELATAQRRCEYLARIIDEHNVPITEFDQIVYTNLI